MLKPIVMLQTGQVLGRALFFLFSLWYLNRYLGVEAKGIWTGVFSLFGILSVFSNMGFEVWLSRAAARSAVTQRQAIGFLFRTKTGLWSLGILVGAYGVWAHDYPAAVVLPFAFALVFDGIGVAEQAVFEGKCRTGAMTLMSFTKSGVFSLVALAVGFWVADPSLPLFAWIFAGVLLLRSVVGWRCWRLLPLDGPRPVGAWREFLLLGAYTFVTVLYFQIDGVMLFAMAGERVTGDYGNAYNFVEGALFLSAAVGAVLYPRLVTAKDEEVRAALFDTFFKLILVVGACGVAGLWLLGPSFGELFAGPEFRGAVPPLLVLACGLPFMFGNGLLSRWLFSVGREGFALTTAAFLAVFNILGNWWAISHYGAVGAAFMTLATEGLLFVIWLLWGRSAPLLLLFWLPVALGLAAVAWVGFYWDALFAALGLSSVLFLPWLLVQARKVNALREEAAPE